MVNYANRNGKSNIVAYEIGADFIDVQFRGGDVYRYTYASAGEWNVENMKTCAYNGFGLNGYIMRNCKYGYASKHKGGAPPDIRTS